MKQIISIALAIVFLATDVGAKMPSASVVSCAQLAARVMPISAHDLSMASAGSAELRLMAAERTLKQIFVLTQLQAASLPVEMRLRIARLQHQLTKVRHDLNKRQALSHEVKKLISKFDVLVSSLHSSSGFSQFAMKPALTPSLTAQNFLVIIFLMASIAASLCFQETAGALAAGAPFVLNWNRVLTWMKDKREKLDAMSGGFRNRPGNLAVSRSRTLRQMKAEFAIQPAFTASMIEHHLQLKAYFIDARVLWKKQDEDANEKLLEALAQSYCRAFYGERNQAEVMEDIRIRLEASEGDCLAVILETGEVAGLLITEEIKQDKRVEVKKWFYQYGVGARLLDTLLSRLSAQGQIKILNCGESGYQYLFFHHFFTERRLPYRTERHGKFEVALGGQRLSDQANQSQQRYTAALEEKYFGIKGYLEALPNGWYIIRTEQDKNRIYLKEGKPVWRMEERKQKVMAHTEKEKILAAILFHRNTKLLSGNEQRVLVPAESKMPDKPWPEEVKAALAEQKMPLASLGDLAKGPAGLVSIASPLEILKAPVENSDYVVRRIASSSIASLKFITGEIQDQYFGRLACFFEITPNVIPAQLPDWRKLGVGYNFTLEQIARFFSVASERHVSLFDQEQLLLDALLEGHWIELEGDGFKVKKESKGWALVSVCMKYNGVDFPSDKLKKIVWHEIHHGIYSTESSYREKIRDWWQKLHADEKQNLKFSYLQNSQHAKFTDEALADEDLVIRELAAAFWAEGAALADTPIHTNQFKMLPYIEAIWRLNNQSTLYRKFARERLLPFPKWTQRYELSGNVTVETENSPGSISEVMFTQDGQKKPYLKLKRAKSRSNTIILESEEDVLVSLNFRDDLMSVRSLSVPHQMEGTGSRIAEWLSQEARRRYPYGQYPLEIHQIESVSGLSLASKFFKPETIQIRKTPLGDDFTGYLGNGNERRYVFADEVDIFAMAGPIKVNSIEGDVIVTKAGDSYQISSIPAGLRGQITGLHLKLYYELPQGNDGTKVEYARFQKSHLDMRGELKPSNELSQRSAVNSASDDSGEMVTVMIGTAEQEQVKKAMLTLVTMAQFNASSGVLEKLKHLEEYEAIEPNVDPYWLAYDSLKNKKGTLVGRDWGGQLESLAVVMKADGIGVINENPFIPYARIPISGILAMLFPERVDFVSRMSGIPMTKIERDSLLGASIEDIAQFFTASKFDSAYFHSTRELVEKFMPKPAEGQDPFEQIIKTFWMAHEEAQQGLINRVQLLRMGMKNKRGQQGWLSKDERYAYIRNLFLNGRIIVSCDSFNESISLDWLARGAAAPKVTRVRASGLYFPNLENIQINNLSGISLENGKTQVFTGRADASTVKIKFTRVPKAASVKFSSHWLGALVVALPLVYHHNPVITFWMGIFAVGLALLLSLPAYVSLPLEWQPEYVHPDKLVPVQDKAKEAVFFSPQWLQDLETVVLQLRQELAGQQKAATRLSRKSFLTLKEETQILFYRAA